MAEKQAVLGNGAKFTGKISNAKSIEINGVVQADLVTEKVTIGSTGNFKGAVKSDLVVIAGEYEGKMKADSIWLTESSRISGEIHYKSLQMDRGAALIVVWFIIGTRKNKLKSKNKLKKHKTLKNNKILLLMIKNYLK